MQQDKFVNKYPWLPSSAPAPVDTPITMQSSYADLMTHLRSGTMAMCVCGDPSYTYQCEAMVHNER